jgi:hypothetical protein
MKTESQNSILRLRRKLFAGLIVFLAAILAIFEFSHRYNYGHFVSYGLHVDVIARESYIGIPGQTKMYEPHLSNFTLLPVSLEACDFVDDTLSPGTEYPYAVQRLDTVSKDWQTVVAVSGEDFCTPTPLSKAGTRIVSKRLWPGSAVKIMDGEATGAREPFTKGDMARFVVFREISKGANWQTAIPSIPFYIQDQVLRD